jgi:hypothetical protein
MKQFILLISTFVYFNCHAQLAPVGTIWNYSHMNSTGGGVSFWGYRFEITKDTVLGGKIYSAFEGSDTFYRTIENKKIYYWLNGNHHLLFDMSKLPNDTMLLEWNQKGQNGMIDTVRLIIDSTFHISDIKGDTLKVFACTRMDVFGDGIKLFFYEKLLYTTYAIDINELPHPVYTGFSTSFACYREPNGYSFLMIDSSECNTVGLFEAHEQQRNILIYPNPANNKITITTLDKGNPFAQISINDIAGKLILNDTTGGTDIRLQLPTVTGGIYFITLQFEDKTTATRKLIIN